MTQPTAKRHHHVPAFYLRGFADGDRITTVRLPGDHRHTQSVRKTAAENGFYAIPGHQDGDDVFEKALSGVEGDASRVFARIAEGEWPLTPEDRATLAYFIALQVSRGPEQRRNMEFLSAQATRMEIGYGGKSNVKAWAKREKGLDLTDAEADAMWEQATQAGGPPIRLTALAHIKQMVKLSGELEKYISGRPWTLFRFRSRRLITSDTPVTLIRNLNDDPNYGVGFMTAWGIIYPLTRDAGLLMNDATMLAERNVPVERVRAAEFDFVQEGTTMTEKFFNGHTADAASMWLYHHPDDARFVPDELPDASPVTMGFSGGEEEFSGESLFGKSRAAAPAPT